MPTLTVFSGGLNILTDKSLLNEKFSTIYTNCDNSKTILRPIQSDRELDISSLKWFVVCPDETSCISDDIGYITNNKNIQYVSNNDGIFEYANRPLVPFTMDYNISSINNNDILIYFNLSTVGVVNNSNNISVSRSSALYKRQGTKTTIIKDYGKLLIDTILDREVNDFGNSLQTLGNISFYIVNNTMSPIYANSSYTYIRSSNSSYTINIYEENKENKNFNISAVTPVVVGANTGGTHITVMGTTIVPFTGTTSEEFIWEDSRFDSSDTPEYGWEDGLGESSYTQQWEKSRVDSYTPQYGEELIYYTILINGITKYYKSYAVPIDCYVDGIFTDYTTDNTYNHCKPLHIINIIGNIGIIGSNYYILYVDGNILHKLIFTKDGTTISNIILPQPSTYLLYDYVISLTQGGVSIIDLSEEQFRLSNQVLYQPVVSVSTDTDTLFYLSYCKQTTNSDTNNGHYSNLNNYTCVFNLNTGTQVISSTINEIDSSLNIVRTDFVGYAPLLIFKDYYGNFSYIKYYPYTLSDNIPKCFVDINLGISSTQSNILIQSNYILGVIDNILYTYMYYSTNDMSEIIYSIDDSTITKLIEPIRAISSTSVITSKYRYILIENIKRNSTGSQLTIRVYDKNVNIITIINISTTLILLPIEIQDYSLYNYTPDRAITELPDGSLLYTYYENIPLPIYALFVYIYPDGTSSYEEAPILNSTPFERAKYLVNSIDINNNDIPDIPDIVPSIECTTDIVNTTISEITPSCTLPIKLGVEPINKICYTSLKVEMV